MKAIPIFISTSKFGSIPAIQYDLNEMDASKKYSLVIFLHGLYEGGDGTKQGLNNLLYNTNHANLLKEADERKFLVLAPQYVQNSAVGWKRQWQDGTEDYFDAVIEWAKANLPIDHTRIYLTGLSAGGGAVWNYISSKQEYADKIAAAVPLCGASIETMADWRIIGVTNMPVWGFHAKDDNSIPWTISDYYIKEINRFFPSPAPIITIYDTGGHGIWNRVYSDDKMYDWLLKQVNVPPAPKKILSKHYFTDGSVMNIYDDKTISFEP